MEYMCAEEKIAQLLFFTVKVHAFKKYSTLLLNGLEVLFEYSDDI